MDLLCCTRKQTAGGDTWWLTFIMWSRRIQMVQFASHFFWQLEVVTMAGACSRPWASERARGRQCETLSATRPWHVRPWRISLTDGHTAGHTDPDGFLQPLPALPRSRSAASTRGTLKSWKNRDETHWMLLLGLQCWKCHRVQTPGRLGSAQPMPQLIMPARNHLTIEFVWNAYWWS